MTDDFDGSWPRVLRRLLAVISGGQLAAARSAQSYVPRVLDELGIDAPPSAQLIPQALTGVASDGRALDTLLRTAVITSKTAVGQGANVQQALARGARWLDMATQTQVADADRVAVETVIASRIRVGGYVRMVNLPACGRCIVLAGAFFRWNAGFDRHPGCDCRHIPAREDTADDVRTEPRKAFDAMTREQQDKAFTVAGAEAVRLGADITQVANARRGMRTTDLYGRRAKITTEGTTRRGVYGGSAAAKAGGYDVTRIGRYGYIKNQTQRRAKRARLMPETIMQVAEDRADAIRLLELYGYITT